MSKKKAVASLLSAAFGVSMLLTGCGTSSSTSGKAAGTTKTSDPFNGTLEIQYFVGGYGDAWWKEVINDFKKEHPKLKIVEDAGPKINQQMQPRWASNNPPDVAYIDGDGSNEAQMVQDGQLMDLTGWLKTAKTADGKLLSDHLTSQPIQFSGKDYSVPLVFGYYGTFYDKALFKQKGWPEPTDFNTFVSDMDKAEAAGMHGYIHQGIYPDYIDNGLLFSAFAANGGDQVLKDVLAMKKGVFLSKPVQDAMKQVQTLRDKGHIDKGALALNHTQSQMEWLQHKAAFIPDGLWLPNEMKDNIPNGFDFGLVPSVMQDAGKKYEVVPYVSDLGIAKNAKNPEAAKAFVQFVFQEKYAIDWVNKSGALNNYKPLDLSKANNAPDWLKASADFLQQPNVHVTPPMNLFNKDIRKAFNDATVAFLSGQTDAKGWGEKVEQAADQIRAQQ